MGIAVEVSSLSSLRAEIWLFPVAISGLAAAILDFPLPIALRDITSSLIELGDHENMGVAVGISSLSSLWAEIWLFHVAISGLAAAAMLDFPLPIALWDVTSSLIELVDRKNIGISPLSSLQPEIWLFSVSISGFAAAMLDFQLQVTLRDITSSLIELGNHENMGEAVGISSLSSLWAEI